MELEQFLGKSVVVTRQRHGVTRLHRGVLVSTSKQEICLVRANGRKIWIPRLQYNDSIEEEKEL